MDFMKHERERGQLLQSLFRLVVVGVEPVGRKLLNVGFSKSSWFGLAKSLGQVEQCLVEVKEFVSELTSIQPKMMKKNK